MFPNHEGHPLHHRLSLNGDDVAAGVPLPPPTRENLKEIRVYLTGGGTAAARDSFVAQILADECAFIRTLLSLFNQLENEGGTDEVGLKLLSEVLRAVIMLSDTQIAEFVVHNDIFMDVFGMYHYLIHSSF